MTARLRFQATYFLLFGAIGILFSFYALYLQRVGLTGIQVGIVLAVMPLARVLVQPVWGLIGDIYRIRRILLSGACFGSALVALVLDLNSNFLWLLVVTVVLAILNGPIGPFCDALSLEYLERHAHRREFGALRLWGSVGFAIASLVIGAFVIADSIRLIVVLYSVAMTLMGLVTATLPDEPHTIRATWVGSPAIFRSNPILIPFLIGITLIGTTLGIVNSYLIIYLTDLGAEGWVSGIVFALAGILEALLMGYASRLIHRWGLRAVLIGGVSLQLLRWVLYSVIVTPIFVIPLQVFHSIAMLALLVAGVLYTDQLLTRQWRATGQTIYSAALHGVGPSIGSFVAGVIYERSGMGMVWWACLIANLCGVAIMAWAMWAPGGTIVSEAVSQGDDSVEEQAGF
jgi:MFS transporter, PPP family, 3-phenylpropionic acid transporter